MLPIFRKTRPRDLPNFKDLFEKFHQILEGNDRVLEIMAELEDKNSGDYIFDINYLIQTTQELSEEVVKIITNLNIFSHNKYPELFEAQNKIQIRLEKILTGNPCPLEHELVVPLEEVDMDCEALVGNKMARLAEIYHHARFRVPYGFSITTRALREFLSFAQLQNELVRQKTPNSPRAPSMERWQQLILETPLPRKLQKQIKKAVRRLKRRGCERFAVRSSSVSEDQPRQSFAGQFRSILNVSENQIEQSYKKIIASSFQKSLYGSEKADLPEQNENDMAVIVQEMVPAVVSGVMYTQDPAHPASQTIVISATYGLGIPLVSGEINADVFRVSRLKSSADPEMVVVDKEKQLRVAADGRLVWQQVPDALRKKTCLTRTQILTLAEIGFVLEREFQRPQDVEWALLEDGTFAILQTRPLQIHSEIKKSVSITHQKGDQRQILLKNRGMIACRGIAAGKVVFVDETTTADEFPIGAVAVTATASPQLAPIVRRSAALITDFGTTTMHLATITREFGVPAIVGTEIATSVLKPGMEVTVDAQENLVYEGLLPELLEYEISGADVFRELPEYKILRRILKNVTPLHLTDPNSSNFSARHCRSYHDIIRYAHEKAVQELINIDVSKRRFPDLKVRELKLIIPLHLKLIDIGGGLTGTDGDKGMLELEQVKSLPMRKILLGLTAPNVWSTEPVDLQFGDFMSSITRFSVTDGKAKYRGENIAVISANYMNLSLRLGYHFNVIDAYVTLNPNSNYVYFRFVGGVTNDERRERRARVIQTILQGQGFTVTVHGDLVIAKLSKMPQDHLEECLVMLGKLIGFTRQLDARMHSDKAVEQYIEQFERYYCQ